MKKFILLFVFFSVITFNCFSQQGPKWSVGGNDINSGEFLGTTNAAALVFKTANIERFTIDANGNIVVKSFITNNSGIVFSDINGVLNKLNYSGIATQYLAGDGSFKELSVTTGWVVDHNNVLSVPTGNVGVGVNNPAEKLDVNGNIKASGIVYANGGLVVGTFKQGTAIVTTALGVGTLTPAEKVDVIGNIKASGNISTSSKVTASAFASNSPLIFEAPLGTERARIDDVNGYLGVGTINPQKKLHIYSGNNPDCGTSLRLEYFFNGTPNGCVGSSLWDITASGEGNSLFFTTNNDNNPELIVKNNGSLIIGGPDLVLGKYDGRANPNGAHRALVHDGWDMGKDELVINYAGDFVNGVRIMEPLVVPAHSVPSLIVDGMVGIGTPFTYNTKGYLLAVNGKIGAKEVEVETTSDAWSDFVFDKSFQLKPIEEVEAYINLNKHLPDVPSAKEVEANGINLGKMDATLLQKIEELTLYVINSVLNVKKK